MALSLCAACAGLQLQVAPSASKRAGPALVELTALKERVGSSLAQLRAGQGWCLDEVQLADLRRQKEELVATTNGFMPAEDQAKLMLSVEVSYQALAAAGKEDKLRHSLAVGRGLASVHAEAEVVSAALLAGVYDETNLGSDELEAVFGADAANNALQLGVGVSQVWKLSELLEGSTTTDGAADDTAEQFERQCQILLAGCDVSDSIVVSLASRLVSMRELYGAMVGQQLGVNRCPPRLATWNLL